jgi:hypothetical protein
MTWNGPLSRAPEPDKIKATMRITLQMEGGIAQFPGLSRPRVIDTASLPDSDAQALEALVEKAAFFTRLAPARTAPGADMRSYELTVEQGDRKRVLCLRDPLGPELSALVARLRRDGTKL